MASRLFSDLQLGLSKILGDSVGQVANLPYDTINFGRTSATPAIAAYYIGPFEKTKEIGRGLRGSNR